ncbi:MAG TPA: hypothetical protein VGP47_04390 [Parachlamydiaceae bacterium]|nr:hypothetical protein [Parachlamydiaceae bacterium]
MKKIELKKMALLGLATGVLLTTGSGIQAENFNTIDLDYVLAKPSCKAHGGCGGLTASRDVYNPDKEVAEEADDAQDAEALPKTKIKEVKKSV